MLALAKLTLAKLADKRLGERLQRLSNITSLGMLNPLSQQGVGLIFHWHEPVFPLATGLSQRFSFTI